MKTPSATDFAEAADAIGIDYPALVEKDYFATQLLKLFLSLDFPGYKPLFTGGTCLSKVHIETKRMSEDIDIKLVAHEKTKHLTRTKQKSIKKQFAILLRNMLVENSYFQHYQEPEFRNEYQFQTYYLEYPRSYSQYSEAIKPYLQLELTEANEYRAATISPVQSIYSELDKQIPEILQCECTTLTTIAAEKLICLLRRTAKSERGLDQQSDQFLIRHVYDFNLITEKLDDLNEVINIARMVIKDDIIKYGKRHEQFTKNPVNELEFGLSSLIKENKYKLNYEGFLGPLVYRKSPIGWSQAIKQFEATFKKISSRLR